MESAEKRTRPGPGAGAARSNIDEDESRNMHPEDDTASGGGTSAVGDGVSAATSGAGAGPCSGAGSIACGGASAGSPVATRPSFSWGSSSASFVFFFDKVAPLPVALQRRHDRIQDRPRRRLARVRPRPEVDPLHVRWMSVHHHHHAAIRTPIGILVPVVRLGLLRTGVVEVVDAIE